MSNERDTKILEMQKKIVEKKAEIKKAKAFSPITNCSLVWNGTRYNLRVIDKETCVMLMVTLNALLRSAEELELEETYLVSGWYLSDWLTDLTSRLNYLHVKEKEAELNAMNERLNQLLSNDTKVNRELEDILNKLQD